MPSRLLGIALACAACALSPAVACDDVRPFDDPCPLPDAQAEQDELHLPLSPDVGLVLRKIRVPGREFWFNQRRLKEFGDPEGDNIFELVTKQQVFGSYPEGGGWYYLLGKYELTKAQAATALGNGSLEEGLKRLNELSGGNDPVDERLAKLAEQGKTLPPKLLAMPVRYLDWFRVQGLIAALNDRCFAYSPCADMLPFADPAEQIKGAADARPDAARSFFRLPTELEWEYAARGGGDLIDDPRFGDIRPFPDDEIGDYAYIAAKDPTRIGRVKGRFSKPVAGLYDLYGNLKEFVADPFTTGLGAGRPGALTARGASISDRDAKEVRASRREEVVIYRFETRGGRLNVRSTSPPTVGIRLALGSQNVDGPNHRRDLETRFEGEDPGAQLRAGGQAPVPVSQLPPSLRSQLPSAALTVEPLRRIEAILTGARPISGAAVDKIRSNLRTVEKQIGEQLDSLRVRESQLAIAAIADYGTITTKLAAAEKTLDNLRDLKSRGILGARSQSMIGKAEEARRLLGLQTNESLSIVFERLRQLNALALADPGRVISALEQTQIPTGRSGAMKRIGRQVALDYLKRNIGQSELARRLDRDFRDCTKTMLDPSLC